ncbi:MAG TPA: transposase family protein [Candidatus Nitrosocosmicus sp.]
MIRSLSISCPFFAFIRGYLKNHCFSNHLLALQYKNLMIYEEITKRYVKHEIQQLSKRKYRKRGIDAGRPFILDTRDKFLMLLVYYRLYITYTLAGYLFDLD